MVGWGGVKMTPTNMTSFMNVPLSDLTKFKIAALQWFVTNPYDVCHTVQNYK
jgi:hypothetical protein